MYRSTAGVGGAPPERVLPALAVCAAFFFLGGLGGCLAACYVEGAAADSLSAYIGGFLRMAQAGGLAHPAVLGVIWNTARWPVLAVLLGFTSLGLLGLPVLFCARGFLLAFSIASFVRIFGGMGCFLAFLVFGVTGIFSVPALFVLGVQSFLAAQALAGRFWGEGRPAPAYGSAYFLRCGVCAAALVLCVVLECLAVPALVSDAAGLLPAL